MHTLRVYCTSGDCRYQVDHYNTDRKFKFRVDETTGVVTIRDQLDADVPRSFSLHVLAIDEGRTSVIFRKLSDCLVLSR